MKNELEMTRKAYGRRHHHKPHKVPPYARAIQSTAMTVGRGVFSDVIEKAQRMAIEYGKNAIKNSIGIEHNFTMQVDGAKAIEAVTNDFIAKYDKNFNNHSTVNHKNERRIINKQFIINLNDYTFIYVAAGNAIGRVEERYFTYSKINDMDLYLYIFGLNYMEYEKELLAIIETINNNKVLGVYNVTSNGGYGYDDDERDSNYESLSITFAPMMPRSLDTLFFSNHEKEDVTEHIDRFNSNKEFYYDRQILYKTGILLFGLPGTGKSSFVKALATKYGRSIININTANLKNIDLTALSQSIVVDESREYIVLFEDIDTLFLNRKDKKLTRGENSVINKLLQFLDSNTSPTNVIFVATTNHIERLDDALLREGRFDLKVEVKPLERDEAFLFGKSFGLSDTTVSEILDIMDDEAKAGTKGTYNQSKLQARLLSRIENRSYDQSAKLHCEEEEIIEIMEEEKVAKSTKKKTTK